jgi:hypothetical protein
MATYELRMAKVNQENTDNTDFVIVPITSLEQLAEQLRNSCQYEHPRLRIYDGAHTFEFTDIEMWYKTKPAPEAAWGEV